MHDFAIFDNEIVPTNSVQLAGLSAAVLIGKGVFTTMAIFDGEPFLWEKHWRRLKEHAARLDIRTAGIEEAELSAALSELLRENRVRDGRVRVTIFDESPTELWQIDRDVDTRVLIVTADRRPPPESFSLTVSPYRLNSASPLAGVKSSNYTEKILALAEARSRGFSECVQINDRGAVASAAMANIFWLKDEILYTPALDTGCLAGTTREYVMENLEVKEACADVDELRHADKIFLTSAGLSVAQVSELDGTATKRMPHPILDLLPAH